MAEAKNQLIAKREEVQRLKDELQQAIDSGHVAKVDMATRAYNNAAARLGEFEGELRELKDRLECLASL